MQMVSAHSWPEVATPTLTCAVAQRCELNENHQLNDKRHAVIAVEVGFAMTWHSTACCRTSAPAATLVMMMQPALDSRPTHPDNAVAASSSTLFAHFPGWTLRAPTLVWVGGLLPGRMKMKRLTTGRLYWLVAPCLRMRASIPWALGFTPLGGLADV